MRFEFINSQKKAYPVRVMCRTLEVSSSGFFAWLKGRGTHKNAERERLKTLVLNIQKQHRSSCGSRRMAQKLSQAGILAGRFRAGRLMKEAGALFVPARKFRVTTDSRHNLPVSPNLLEQNFHVEAPNQVWVSDITYLWSGEGWSYMATIIDLFNREVVGMAIKDRMDRSLIIEALKAAVWSKKPATGLIFHSDRGSQYCSDEFRSLLAFYGMKSSMSRKGNCWDNAVAESFFASLKKERTLRTTYRTRQELYSDVFEYVNMFYNCNRGHSYLAYKAPIEFASVNKARMAA